jgi:methylated-DNA-[protein]-cysteine S-methyltransferase
MEEVFLMEKYKAYYKSEIGFIEIIGTEQEILSVDFIEEKPVDNTEVPLCLKECLKQIDEYFKGNRKEFSVQLKLDGTDFQKKVWRELMTIPFGKTVSYRDIAKGIGNIKAVRAVGNANGKNKIPIIIPCHRVIASDGSMGGFSSGIWRKEWLLKHEGR